MALNKKIEFGKKCGVSTAYVAVHIKRGKIIVTEDGMVDDTNVVNMLFMQNCLARPKKEQAADKPAVKNSSKKEKLQIPPKTKVEEEKSNKLDERFDLDTEKKRIDVERLRRESMVQEAQHLRMMGKSLPTEPVRTLFIQTIKAYTVAFKQAADKIVGEYAARHRLNRNDVAELKGLLISAINRAADDGNEEAKKSVNNIVREYSQVK